MFVTVTIKSIYGNQAIYPACERADAFASIAGTRTLTPQVIKQIKALGYEVRVQQEHPSTL
jgi:hypothetical protein